MFISKLICDKCGTEVTASDKYCKECGTAGYNEYVIDKEVSDEDRLFDLWKKSQPKPYKKDKAGISSLDESIKEPAICKSCGKIVSSSGTHMCPGLRGGPRDILLGVIGNLGPK